MAMKLFLPPRSRYYNTRSMPIDVIETEEGYLVKANLPGYNKDDIKVEADFESLRIEAKYEAEDDVKYLLRERPRTDLSRILNFSKPINAAAAKVSFEKGVLEITLPLSEEAKTHFLVPEN